MRSAYDLAGGCCSDGIPLCFDPTRNDKAVQTFFLEEEVISAQERGASSVSMADLDSDGDLDLLSGASVNNQVGK